MGVGKLVNIPFIWIFLRKPLMPLKKNPKENKKTPPKLKGLQILQSRKKTNIDSNNSHKGNRTLARYIYRIVSIKSFKEEKKPN